MIKYLYIPDLPGDVELLDKVCDQFLKKAFISDAELIIVVKTGEMFVRYIKKWTMKTFGLGSQFRFVMADKFYRGLLDYYELMNKADCYISGSMSTQEYTFTEMAYDQKKDIISARLEDIFEDMPTKPEKVEGINEIKDLIKNIQEDFPMDEYEWLLFHQGLGESCAFFYYVKNYREKIGKKLACFCFDKTRQTLLEESPYIDAVILIPSVMYAYIAIYMAEEFKIKNFLLLHFLPLSTDYLNEPYKIYPAYLPKVRDFFELDKDASFERYPVNISQKKIDYVNNLFDEMKLKRGKTVFLIMDGISNGNFAESRRDFFIELANTLRKKGYEVVTKGNSEIIEGYKFTILPPWESALFAGLCGNVVTIPTGIPHVMGAFNQSDRINIHYLWWTSVDEPAVKASIDAWYLEYIPLIRTFGKKYFIDCMVKNQEMANDFMNSKKVNFISYTDEVWDEQMIDKIIKNL